MTGAELPDVEFAFPGPLRDRLVAAILSGAKTATASLATEYGPGEPLPRPGDRGRLIDSAGDPVAVLQTTEVRQVRLADVDDAHARAEGEGYADAADWRRGHERFWTSPEYVAAVGGAPALGDDTMVVTERFRVVRRIHAAG